MAGNSAITEAGVRGERHCVLLCEGNGSAATAQTGSRGCAQEVISLRMALKSKELYLIISISGQFKREGENMLSYF